MARRVRVAAVNDYEIIVAGLANLLSRFPERLEVCERVVVGEPIHTPVDVALYDVYGRSGVAAPMLRKLVGTPEIAHVAVFTLDLRPELIADAQAAGATGFISKSLPGDAIADALVRIAAGELVIAGSSGRTPRSELDWPGRDDGLTERESQVLVLVAEGLSNREVAAALYLSPETVKGYLRQVYAKLGLRNRVDATNYVRQAGTFTRHRSAHAEAGLAG